MNILPFLDLPPIFETTALPKPFALTLSPSFIGWSLSRQGRWFSLTLPWDMSFSARPLDIENIAAVTASRRRLGTVTVTDSQGPLTGVSPFKGMRDAPDGAVANAKQVIRYKPSHWRDDNYVRHAL